jgi:hypothetical protein
MHSFKLIQFMVILNVTILWLVIWLQGLRNNASVRRKYQKSLNSVQMKEILAHAQLVKLSSMEPNLSRKRCKFLSWILLINHILLQLLVVKDQLNVQMKI